MPTLTSPGTSARVLPGSADENKNSRIASIDLLRGVVMIVMALDHVRDYFHRDAFLYSPTDLTQTSGILFFTRFVTHYCAPVFVFVAGISAYLFGIRRTKKQLAGYLLSRGLWLVLTEMLIISLAQSFNPEYPIINLQVIWAIGISMIVLSALIFLKRPVMLTIAVALVAGHNLFDNVHVTGSGASAFLWSLLHEPRIFMFGHVQVFVHYPVIPWIGTMALGYFFGSVYQTGYDSKRRLSALLLTGLFFIVVFLLLRTLNIYGDPAPWTMQKNAFFTFLSILNVTKYPPSLQYILITVGPAMIFLALAERLLNRIAEKIIIFGKSPFFYYVVHIYLIHLLALIGAVALGYDWKAMILKGRINGSPELKGYGFNLTTVYAVWIVVILVMFPLCKRFAAYKKRYGHEKWWLRYL